MPSLEEDLSVLKEKDRRALLPMTEIQGIRLTKPQRTALHSVAMRLQTTHSQIARLLLVKGAAVYGIDLNRIL